ncbi:MAG: acyltransferase family protein [Myxococcota bacterium]
MSTREERPPTTSVTLRDPRFALFDSMRAVAVLAVIGMHLGFRSRASFDAWYGVFTSHLNIGVHIFFLISAFLLYRPHAVALLDGPAPASVATYARRRLLRIVPAYWVALTLLTWWLGLRGVFTGDWWIYYGFGQAYDAERVFKGIPAAWSLTVEVGFYVALPLQAFALRRLCRGLGPDRAVRRQLVLLAVLGIAGEIARNAVNASGNEVYKVTYPGLLLDFCVGMSLAVLSARVGDDEGRWAWVRWIAGHSGTCWALALGLYLLACVTPVFERIYVAVTPAQFAAEHLVYVAVTSLLLLPAIFGERRGGLPRRLLETRLLCWIGRISYGVFLWHQPLLVALKQNGADGWIPGAPVLSLTLAILPVALFCGWASFHLVERPAMRWRAGWRRASRQDRGRGPGGES